MDATCDALNDTMDATIDMTDKRFAMQAAGWGWGAPKKSARSECLMAPAGQGAHLPLITKDLAYMLTIEHGNMIADMIICSQ